jgi:phosphohistidine phosphatase SixA
LIKAITDRTTSTNNSTLPVTVPNEAALARLSSSLEPRMWEVRVDSKVDSQKVNSDMIRTQQTLEHIDEIGKELNRQMAELKDKLACNFAAHESRIEALKRQQNEVTTHLSVGAAVVVMMTSAFTALHFGLV